MTYKRCPNNKPHMCPGDGTCTTQQAGAWGFVDKYSQPAWNDYKNGRNNMNPLQGFVAFIFSILDNPYYGDNHRGSPW